jgi:phosphatidylserine/phosphatidylglycerophosphate/cardiolipin synthase-like enzyme
MALWLAITNIGGWGFYEGDFSMKAVFFFIQLFSLASLAASETATFKTTPESFISYIQQYKTPELFYDNNDAFAARIKLLDQAPAGANAKILTFVYDNGETTRRLAAHMCKAAQRGVIVEFMADSKTGDRPGQEDAFDSPVDHKINEEVYQYLANCGVYVGVHNHIPEFDTLWISRARIPKFDTKKWNIGTDHKIYQLLTRISEIINGEFSDVVKTKLNSWGLGSLNVWMLANDLRKVMTGIKTGDSEDIDLLGLFRDYNLTSLSSEDLARRLLNVKNKFMADPVLREAYQRAREFNRLNHRKLFWIRHDNKNCFFLGGRNLGDHYLQWDDNHDSFVDGDVLTCSHHRKAGDEDIEAEAEQSFNELWTDTTEKHQVTFIKPNPKYKFKYLLLHGQTFQYIPRNVFDNTQAVKNTDPEKFGPVESRTLPKAILMRDHNVAVHGSAMPYTANWRVRTSSWDSKNDQVRQELYKSILAERQEVYIETAYSEMDDEFRRHIESALKKGVNVTLVTNSFFVLDAGSKAIRLTMGLWVRKLLNEYGLDAHMAKISAVSGELRTNNIDPRAFRGVFTYKVASILGGHMIHFKGAGFKCQEVATPQGLKYKKTFLIGSHNFHPRSGHSDKEHAILWDQPSAPNCQNSLDAQTQDIDMIDLRKTFYKKLNNMYGGEFLKTYNSLYWEIDDALKSGELSGKKAKIAKGIMTAVFKSDGNGNPQLDESGKPQIRQGLQGILEVLEAVGLRDFIGVIL